MLTDSLVKVAYPMLRTEPFYAKSSALRSQALSQGVNIKWLAEYKSDSREHLERTFVAKTETFSETLPNGTDAEVDEEVEKEDGK